MSSYLAMVQKNLPAEMGLQKKICPEESRSEYEGWKKPQNTSPSINMRHDTMSLLICWIQKVLAGAVLYQWYNTR